MTNFCVLDLETSISKGPHGSAAKDPNNDFFTVIIGERNENMYVLHKKEGFNRELPHEAVVLINNTDVIIGHNLPFDLSYIWGSDCLEKFLLRGGKVWDTQIAEYLLSGQRHSFASLAELQQIYLGSRIKEDRISKLFKKGIGADLIVKAAAGKEGDFFGSRIPRLFELYDKYCHDDGVTTMQVFQKQYAKAKQLGMIDVIKLYNMYMLTLTNVMNTGIPVDLEKCEKTLRDFKLKSISYLDEAIKLITPMWDTRLGDFNINSPKDKSAILFGGTYIIKVKKEDGTYKNGNIKYKIVDEEITIKGFGVPTTISEESKIKGRYATGADILEKIYKQSNNDQLKKYCELQKQSMTYGKMCSTYLEPFLNLSIKGLLYPNFNNTLTITSRLSSSKPNLQNVPSKGDMLLPIQGQLIAPEGWVACSFDYSQLEIYCVAYLSKDPQLIDDLLNGVDFHVKRLSYAEDKPYAEVYDLCKVQKIPEWESKRTAAKTISYQKAYGASPKSLSKTTGIDESIIKKIFDQEDLEYPLVAEFNKSVLDQVLKNQEYSLEKNIPDSKKGNGKESKKFLAGMELLPIINHDGNIIYKSGEYRHVGYYTCRTGKRYSFEEIGRIGFSEELRRGYSHTQTRNYHIQGTASDVQAASSASLLKLLLKNPDKVKMVNEIHDSKWFLIKKEYLSRIISIIRDKMEDVPTNFKKYLDVDIPFKIPVDVKIGKNFAEMSALDSLESLNSIDYTSFNKEG